MEMRWSKVGDGQNQQHNYVLIHLALSKQVAHQAEATQRQLQLHSQVLGAWYRGLNCQEGLFHGSSAHCGSEDQYKVTESRLGNTIRDTVLQKDIL